MTAGSGKLYTKHPHYVTSSYANSSTQRIQDELQTSGPPTISIFPTLLPQAVTRSTLKNKQTLRIAQISITSAAKRNLLIWVGVETMISR